MTTHHQRLFKNEELGPLQMFSVAGEQAMQTELDHVIEWCLLEQPQPVAAAAVLRYAQHRVAAQGHQEAEDSHVRIACRLAISEATGLDAEALYQAWLEFKFKPVPAEG